MWYYLTYVMSITWYINQPLVRLLLHIINPQLVWYHEHRFVLCNDLIQFLVGMFGSKSEYISPYSVSTHWSDDQSANNEVVGLMGRPTGCIGVMTRWPMVWFWWWPVSQLLGGWQGMLEWWPVSWQWGGGSDGAADGVCWNCWNGIRWDLFQLETEHSN